MKLLFLLLALAGPLACAQTTFRAGAAQVAITPPNGAPMAGYYHARGGEGALDPLFAKALVLDDGSNKVALITLDLISTTFALTRQARDEIQRLTRIPGSNVMISATHAHTGPELAERGARSALLGEGSGTNSAIATYSQSLPSKIAEAVQLAAAALTNVQIHAATARCENLAFNRRFYMKDGSVMWNPGKLNPDINIPAGSTDPELHALFFEPPHRPAVLPPALAVYVNFAMHPDTVGGASFSADYPGALSRRIAEYHGPNVVTLFANGACGNINHTDVSWPRQQNTRAEADRIGTILAANIFLAEKQRREIKPASIRVRSEMVQLPLAPITPEQIDQARLTARTGNDKTRDNFINLVKAFQVLDVAAREGKPLQVEVQVITLGNEIAWVSLPGEIFVELGLSIKKRSPFKTTIIAELANGSIGYIPDRRAYAEGAYEPISARCAPGSGEILVETASRLLRDLAK